MSTRPSLRPCKFERMEVRQRWRCDVSTVRRDTCARRLTREAEAEGRAERGRGETTYWRGSLSKVRKSNAPSETRGTKDSALHRFHRGIPRISLCFFFSSSFCFSAHALGDLRPQLTHGHSTWNFPITATCRQGGPIVVVAYRFLRQLPSRRGRRAVHTPFRSPSQRRHGKYQSCPVTEEMGAMGDVERTHARTAGGVLETCDFECFSLHSQEQESKRNLSQEKQKKKKKTQNNIRWNIFLLGQQTAFSHPFSSLFFFQDSHVLLRFVTVRHHPRHGTAGHVGE